MNLPRTALALATALLLPAAPAAADTVTTLDDSGAGSLRAAIAATPAGGTVTFAPGVEGTILLTDELLVDKDLTIDGPGARRLTLSGGDTTRVVRVSQSGADVRIAGLTIAHGRAGDPLPFGGGLLVEFAGSVRLERVALVDNAVDSGAPFPGLGAGAFVRDGSFELVESTVARNRVLDEDGGGGGLFLAEAGTTFAIAGSTIAANEADLGAGVTAAGASGTIEASTIARNVAETGGGIATSTTVPLVTLERALVTANEAATGSACSGLVESRGGSVVDALAGCAYTAGTGDVTGVAAAVGALGDHGGPTDTALPGGPAIDVAACSGSDQRGVARPQGAGCDAGAVELRAAQLAASGPLALGSAQVGQQTAPASAVISNTGERDAAIDAVALTGPNAAEVVPVAGADACTAASVLAPGESCVLRARLAPAGAGPKQATYTVALAGSSVDVPVTGAGEPAAPPPGGGTDPPPPADPAPPPPPSAAAVLVGSTSRMGKGGKVKLRLRCTTVGAARCEGSLTLKLGSRRLTRAYSIAAGAEAVVTLKLATGDRRRLARRRSLRPAVTVVTAQPDGTRRTTHQGTVKLLP